MRTCHTCAVGARCAPSHAQTGQTYLRTLRRTCRSDAVFRQDVLSHEPRQLKLSA